MILQFSRTLLCFVLLSSFITSDAYAEFIFNGHTYDVTPTAGSWTDAEAFAVTQGGHLVTIDDAAENEFIRTTFLNISGNQEDFWIGLFSPAGPANDASTYEWVSGSASTYRNWRTPDQPDLGSGTDFYAAINFLLNDDGSWDNYPNTGFREIRGIYEIIPEPSSGWLLGSVLLAIGIHRQRSH